MLHLAGAVAHRIAVWRPSFLIVRPANGSARPIGIECMQRRYFLQQWYSLADEALENAVFFGLGRCV